MNISERAPAVADLLALEALYLDTRRWDDWHALFEEDAVFWVPAWTGPDTLTTSPETEISWIYVASRAGLEERVWRVKSGLSIASTPLARTHHSIAPPVTVQTADGMTAYAAGTVLVFDAVREQRSIHYCRYEYDVRMHADDLKIARKKITLVDDRAIAMLDFYAV